MEVGSVFVTGANRGIGLELVRQISQLPKSPKFIFATYRNQNAVQALEDLQNKSQNNCKIITIQMDVRKSEDRENARKIVEENVGNEGLTLLINNAGIAQYLPFATVTEEDMLLHFTSNTIGPVVMVKEMLPLLQKAAASSQSKLNVSRAAVLNMSSMAGSIMDVINKPRSWLGPFSYRTSKAALNMAMRIVASELKDQGILVVQMCPGYVKTQMTQTTGEIEVDESVSDILTTLSVLDDSHQGAYIDRKGQPIAF